MTYNIVRVDSANESDSPAFCGFCGLYRGHGDDTPSCKYCILGREEGARRKQREDQEQAKRKEFMRESDVML